MSMSMTKHGVHLGKPCTNCGADISDRSKYRLCIRCYQTRRPDLKGTKPVSRGGFSLPVRVVHYSKPRLWADVVAKARVQARRADGYVTSSLNPIYSPDFSPVVSKLPDGVSDEG